MLWYAWGAVAVLGTMCSARHTMVPAASVTW
jgi:hypothetical protein